MKRTVFLVDDHSVMRWGYAALINQETDLEVCGEAESAAEAMEKIATGVPDLVIVDISLEGMNGIELTKHLHALYPELPILVISMYEESLYAERALRAGARGYVMKKEARTKIVEAVRHVLGGGFHVSEAMSSLILHQYHGRRTSAVRASVERLSDRELEVFELMGKGYNTNQIAESLGVSPKTVSAHRGNIKEKMDVRTTQALMRQAVQWVFEHGVA